MEISHKRRPVATNWFYIFLLLSTNLLTLLLSTTFYSCSLSRRSAVPEATVTIPSQSTVRSSATTSLNSEDDLAPEFKAFTSGQLLPFGVNPNFDSDTMYPPVGRPCTMFPDLLRRFMTYKVNGSCPDDELLAQKLLLKGCEPLPRRRCRHASPLDYVEPYPLPTSLWTTPSSSHSPPQTPPTPPEISSALPGSNHR